MWVDNKAKELLKNETRPEINELFSVLIYPLYKTKTNQNTVHYCRRHFLEGKYLHKSGKNADSKIIARLIQL